MQHLDKLQLLAEEMQLDINNAMMKEEELFKTQVTVYPLT